MPQLPPKKRFCLSLLVPLALLSGLITGCSQESAEQEHEHPMAALQEMSVEVQSAPATVQEAYRFAAANPDITQNIPCYCGCGAMGHTSNYACYFTGEDEDGKLQFDTHALGCSICVDITQDAMRMMDQGKTTQEIRSAIDNTYAQYGPSNMP